jgi:hypothetical protein
MDNWVVAGYGLGVILYWNLNDEMEVLAVGGYEDGGALPLCDVVRNEKVTFYE